MKSVGRVRVGVIGAGSWTISSHLPNLLRHPDVELVAVSRKGPDLLAWVKDEFGFAVASEDYRDVLDADVDVCVVGSPSALHFEHARAALESGAHVMCEKPFTVDPGDAWELVATAERVHRHLVVAFGWNYQQVAQAAQAFMADGGIGELEQMSVTMSSVTRELLSNTGAYPGASDHAVPESRTWTDPSVSGGGYGQAQLSHALGLALWLTGARIDSGIALMSAPMDAPVELHDAMTMRFDNGAIGVLSGGSSHLGASRYSHALEIRAIGSEGQIMVDTEREAAWHYRDGRERAAELPAGSGRQDCVGPIDAIVAAGRGEPFENASPGELGARTVEVLDIAYRSARSGRLESRRTTPSTNGRGDGSAHDE